MSDKLRPVRRLMCSMVVYLDAGLTKRLSSNFTKHTFAFPASQPLVFSQAGDINQRIWIEARSTTTLNHLYSCTRCEPDIRAWADQERTSKSMNKYHKKLAAETYSHMPSTGHGVHNVNDTPRAHRFISPNTAMPGTSYDQIDPTLRQSAPIPLPFPLTRSFTEPAYQGHEILADSWEESSQLGKRARMGSLTNSIRSFSTRGPSVHAQQS
jgi:hypothetical protein